MQENRDHFSSEIKNIYLKYIPCKTLKLYWQSSSCFQCFPFPKKYSLPLSSFSLSFTFFCYPSIHSRSICLFIHPSNCSSSIHHSSVHPVIYPLSTIYPSFIQPSINHPSIHHHPFIIHHPFIHHLSIICLDICLTIHRIIHLLISKDNLSYYQEIWHNKVKIKTENQTSLKE